MGLYCNRGILLVRGNRHLQTKTVTVTELGLKNIFVKSIYIGKTINLFVCRCAHV